MLHKLEATLMVPSGSHLTTLIRSIGFWWSSRWFGMARRGEELVRNRMREAWAGAGEDEEDTTHRKAMQEVCYSMLSWILDWSISRSFTAIQYSSSSAAKTILHSRYLWPDLAVQGRLFAVFLGPVIHPHPTNVPHKTRAHSVSRLCTL